ncbi:hypothetical protein HOLleu_03452 [Holothuria leucospilota]|uniref:Uncharacterized protein n=1 Tax=Holothuria leucospilota TaxID=206669 RepID=A0A9Q1CSV3_HOLLE|nr:hypothetical protein HOLleu_03452 [Holothuria leucospilota]
MPMLQLQTHKHSKTFRKKPKAVCRFGFPKPPMKYTKLLHPLPPDTDPQMLQQHQENYQKITELLKTHVNGLDITFEQFLKHVNLNEEEYIEAIRTSIKAPTVFLKRNPNAIRINPYMKNLLQIYGANHDIQYITDPYACAVYIVAYMSKSQRGMSRLLDNACKEAKKETSDLRRQVRLIGNKFINAVEVSMAAMIVNVLTHPKERGHNKACYAIAEDLKILEVTIAQNEDSSTSSLATKLQQGKFVVLQQYNINDAEGATYLRLTNGKSKIFQTGKTFHIPEHILESFYNPPQCTVPEALASPKKKIIN